MLFYIYLTGSLCGSGLRLALNGADSVLSGIGQFVLFFILFYLLFFLLHLLVFAVGGYTINTERLPEDIHTWYRWYGFESLLLLIKTLRIRVHLHDTERMPVGEPYLLVGNHRSVFDPMVGLAYYKKYDLAFISKQENLKIPFVGRYIAAVGCLPLDRENPKNAVKTIRRAAENIKRGYANYGIYPEGWENKTSDPLLPFRSGAFKIAKDAGCQIVLMAIRNSDHIFRRAFTLRPIHIHVNIVGVIPAEDVRAAKTAELSDRAFKVLGDYLTAHPADDWKLGRRG